MGNPYQRVSVLVICRVCRRKVRAYVPQHGDGSRGVPYKHKDDLDGSDCDGSLDSAEIVDGS